MLQAWERGLPIGRFVQDPHLGWRLDPGHKGGARINSLGFRGPEFEPEKPPGVDRVFCAGDSSAYGDGVEEDDHYTALVQREIDKISPGRFQVINAGVGGYTSYQVRVLVEEVIIPLGPDVVTILVGVNDFFPALNLPDKYSYKSDSLFGLNSILTRSEIYRVLKRLLFPLCREIYRSIDKGSDAAKTDGYDFSLRVSGPGLVDNIGAVADLGMERGFKVVLFQYPPNRFHLDDPHECTKYLSIAARHENITFVDLQAPFVEAVKRGDNPFQADGGHPNALGNRIIADALFRALEDLGYVDRSSVTGTAPSTSQAATSPR